MSAYTSVPPAPGRRAETLYPKPGLHGCAPHFYSAAGPPRAALLLRRQHLAFVKRQWGLGRFTRGSHETAFLLAKGRPRKPTTAIADVFDWQRDKVTYHPNQKPVAALASILKNFCPEAGKVLDPFMGGGSTLRAAKDLGISAVGIEIELKYCQKAVKRLAQNILPRINKTTFVKRKNKQGELYV